MKTRHTRTVAAVAVAMLLVTCAGTTLAQRHSAPLEAAAAARPCSRASVWCGFDSATFRRWARFDGNATTPQARRRHFELRTGRSPQGGYWRYFRAVLDGNAVASGEYGERTLLSLFPAVPPRFGKTAAFEGSDAWYHTSVRFPSSFHPSPNTTWNWVVEWHNWPDAPCCANIALTVDTTPPRSRSRRHRNVRHPERLSLRIMGGGDPSHPVDDYGSLATADPAVRTRWFVGDRQLQRDHWYDLLLHVRWSYIVDQGLVQWWLDGRLVTSTHMPTLFYYADDNSDQSGATPGPGQAYLEIGYYRPLVLPRDAMDRSVSVVDHGGTRRGPTRGSVAY